MTTTQYELTTIDDILFALAEFGSWAALARATDIPVSTLRSRAQADIRRTIAAQAPWFDAVEAQLKAMAEPSSDIKGRSFGEFDDNGNLAAGA